MESSQLIDPFENVGFILLKDSKYEKILPKMLEGLQSENESTRATKKRTFVKDISSQYPQGSLSNNCNYLDMFSNGISVMLNSL